MIVANYAFSIHVANPFLPKVWQRLGIFLLLVFLFYAATICGSDASELQSHIAQPKRKKHKSHKSKNTLSNSQVLRAKAYPRTNFMPYGYFSAARNQGVDLQSWNHPAPIRSKRTILESMTKSPGATGASAGSDDELSKLIDAQLGRQPQPASKSTVAPEPKSEKLAPLKVAAADPAKTAEKFKSQPGLKEQAITKKDSPLFSDENAAAHMDHSNHSGDKADKSDKADRGDLKNMPLVKNNALLNSVFGKMAAIKFPQIGFASFSINLVTVFVAAGMALFWLFMIFSALCGSRDRGMRARLSEHKRNDDQV